MEEEIILICLFDLLPESNVFFVLFSYMSHARKAVPALGKIFKN